MRKFLPWELFPLIVLCLSLGFLLHDCLGNKPGQTIKATTIQAIPSWKNNAGDSVFSIRVEEYNEALEAENRHLRDSIAKVYKTTGKRIKQLMVLATRSQADLKPVDSLQISYKPSPGDCPPVATSMQQTFATDYYTARVRLGDSSYMQLEAYDTLTALWKRARTGSIFNRRSFLQLDISLANQNTKVAGLRMYHVPDAPPPKWGIGVIGGYGIAPVSGKPDWFLGVGICRNFIRF